MNRRLTAYVIVVSAAAMLGAGLLFAGSPYVRPDGFSALALMSVLALVAELLSFLLPNSASGSLAFIPYLASALIVPAWPALAAMMLVRFVAETARKGSRMGSAFNLAQHALTLSLSILIFKLLHGESMLVNSGASLLRATQSLGAPALLAFAASFLCNGTLACAYLALQSNQRFSRLWRQMILPTIGLDLVAGPMVFVFAWLYVAHGAIAAAALWVPLLGLREVHRANLTLQRTNEELLQLMIKSIEARDPYTSGHSRRVQHHSMVIARAIGLTEREVERVGKAALLHDVGKIYEKYAPILRKADKLTPDEWATMQEHPIDGANLVGTMSGLKELVPAVRHHHEWWDGNGYPDGLVGDAIPLESRIITFADTIDAMTSERPYRRPLTEDEVRAEILGNRGRQFDPSIADRFVGTAAWDSLFEPSHSATPRFGLSLVTEQRRTSA